VFRALPSMLTVRGARTMLNVPDVLQALHQIMMEVFVLLVLLLILIVKLAPMRAAPPAGVALA
jgi:hypothetical protein